MNTINIDDFQAHFFNPYENGQTHTHPIDSGKIRGRDKTWIRKKHNSLHVALIEQLSQEFFRLLLPHHPKTIVAMKNQPFPDYYILSEKISFHRLPSGYSEGFSNFRFRGLGEVLVIALFLQEVDLKKGNVGLDNENRVVKIDGDCSLAELNEHYLQKMFSLSLNTLEALPNLEGAYAYHWLDCIIKEVKIPVKNRLILHNKTINSLQIQHEIYVALMKLYLIPDEFMYPFVTSYVDVNFDIYLDFLKKRLSTLKGELASYSAFHNYSHEHLSKSDFHKDFLWQLISFNWHNNPQCRKYAQVKLISDFKNNLHKLGLVVEYFTNLDKFILCDWILSQLTFCQNDLLGREFIIESKNKLLSCKNNELELNILLNQSLGALSLQEHPNYTVIKKGLSNRFFGSKRAHAEVLSQYFSLLVNERKAFLDENYDYKNNNNCILQ